MKHAAQEASNTTPTETVAAVISKRAQNKGRKAVEVKAARLGRLSVKYVPLDSVYPNTYNPNRQSEHDFELLVRSIEEDGFDAPIICNMEGVIVDGEHRWRAAKVVGMTDIPIVRVEMTPEQMRISTIRHNRARGTHDVELEAEVLRDLQELGALDWAQEALMMSDVEVNRLLNDISVPEVMADEDFSEAWIPETISKEEADLIESDADVNLTIRQSREKGEVASAATAQAVNTQRRRAVAIQHANTEQERMKARKEHNVFRLSLTFSSEEGQVIKKALGKRPGERLLEMCHRESGE
jgi:ParB-like chromosome segregation protein Spo0J